MTVRRLTATALLIAGKSCTIPGLTNETFAAAAGLSIADISGLESTFASRLSFDFGVSDAAVLSINDRFSRAIESPSRADLLRCVAAALQLFACSEASPTTTRTTPWSLASIQSPPSPCDSIPRLSVSQSFGSSFATVRAYASAPTSGESSALPSPLVLSLPQFDPMPTIDVPTNNAPPLMLPSLPAAARVQAPQRLRHAAMH